MTMIEIIFYSIILCVSVVSSIAIAIICFRAYIANKREGQLTPEEKVREWEAFKICAPGDAVTATQTRCNKFKNCRECLKDYAKNNPEKCISIYNNVNVAKNN